MKNINVNIDIIAFKLGLSRKITWMVIICMELLLLCFNLLCFIILTNNKIDSETIEELYDYSIESQFVTLDDVPGDAVYAGREEKPINTDYDKFGLPTKRKWLTASEWQGKHLTDPMHKSIFKTWKVIHMNTFLDYMKHAAKQEVKVDEYKTIPASLIVAQSIIESGWGTSKLAMDADNLFGHKCHDCTEPSDYLIAADDSPTDKFAIKRTKWISIRDHSKLLMRKYAPRIPNLRKNNPDIRDWLDALCGCGRELSVEKALKHHKSGKFSYATSCYKGEGYAKKIMDCVNQYKLNELDGK
jgi:flagellum-specific peptidoglycan hydrolase FlgJ